MPTGFASSIEEFVGSDKHSVIGKLVNACADAGFENQKSRQIVAWGEEIDLLKKDLLPIVQEDRSKGGWHIILEYDLPRREKRPDVVFLAREVIIVLEFKIGATSYDASSRWQAEDYALNFRDFHAESANHRIVPVLCATQAGYVAAEHDLVFSSSVANLQLTNADGLGACLKKAYEAAHRPGATQLVLEKWLRSAYRPSLTIIEAAERLYENHDVREISHSYAENLDKTTDMLTDVIVECKAKRKHTICFVTGVPGAGKTLTGLNVVHDPAIRSKQGPSGIFLSGNGPLVKVIRGAIVQNQLSKGRRRRDCEHEVSTFIQNVHNFLRYHRDDSSALPHEHVLVFDEAQRAWNREQMKRKRGVDASEPSQLLDVMERLPDWAVVIALVGGGQEIFLGEAGLEEWGRALLCSKKKWSIVASPEVLSGGASVAGHRLFDRGLPPGIEFGSEPLAHLEVSVRSHRAQLIAEWVNALLLPDASIAATKCPDHREFPIVLTRNLDAARAWLRCRSSGDANKRSGLVSTSEDQRFRAYGLENSSAFRQDYPFDKWFLAAADDVRSSFALEVSASEFECQGLELDWVGVCWGADLTPSESDLGWEYRKFRGAKWQKCNPVMEREYIQNRYRVLLTRARLGMVIWVPPGSPADPTRDPRRFDRVYEHLKAAGVPEMDESEVADQ